MTTFPNSPRLLKGGGQKRGQATFLDSRGYASDRKKESPFG